MNNIAAMPPEERREIVLQTSARTGMSPAIIEKDFWVCWVLDRLFRSPLKDKIIFKGGTSLSKAYHLINRFSEDIDLILDWSGFAALNQGDPAQRLGKSPRKKMLEALDSWGLDCIHPLFSPWYSGSVGSTVPRTCPAPRRKPSWLNIPSHSGQSM